VLKAQEILALEDQSVPGFILAQARSHRLSQLMKQLNAEVLGPDPDARKLAAQAIERLGFPLSD